TAVAAVAAGNARAAVVAARGDCRGDDWGSDLLSRRLSGGGRRLRRGFGGHDRRRRGSRGTHATNGRDWPAAGCTSSGCAWGHTSSEARSSTLIKSMVLRSYSRSAAASVSETMPAASAWLIWP